jgi:hypothetical protein
MSDTFVGSIVAFRGEEDYITQQDVMVEITEVKEGMVEMAFNFPASGKPRVYLSVPLAEVVRRSMAGDD